MLFGDQKSGHGLIQDLILPALGAALGGVVELGRGLI